MATLSIKPNSRKTTPLNIPKSSQGEGKYNDESEIINIPKGMPFSSIRELSNKAMKARN